ncbi:MAG: hypothetical protein ABI718_18830 [Acidobacteriota bacterium]
MPNLSVLLLLLPLVAGDGQAQRRRPVSPPANRSIVILFVGNSLTAVNDLPGMVCRMAAQTGKALLCDSVVAGGFSLDDHLATGTAARRIAEGRWNIVALQQGPSALPESRDSLRASAAEFATIIRASRATPALYAVWPWESRSFDFPAVAESYRLATEDVGGLLFPAGQAWTEAWKRDRLLPLYGPDLFHPSATGTYLAALVIYRQIFGSIPIDLVGSDVANAVAMTALPIGESKLIILRKAAEDACGGPAGPPFSDPFAQSEGESLATN